MSTIFSKIIKGEIPCYKIAEDDNFLAFLDISPLALGHTLVIPKQEVDYIFDIEDDTLCNLHVFSKRVAKAIKSIIPCEKIGMSVIGLEVAHAHIHLIPMNKVSDMDFSQPKLSFSKEEMQDVCDKIQAVFI